MATFTGTIVPSALDETAITLNTTVRQAFYNNAHFSNVATAFLASGLVDGTYTDEPSNPDSNNHTGIICTGYAAIFYNRIFVIPNPLDLGNLVSDKSGSINVFNGFFSPKTLEDIVETNVQGLTLNGPSLPTIFAPLQEIEYIVDAEVSSGPPTIDASYFYDFAGTANDLTVAVIGARVLALPYLFQAGLLERLNWKTEVITSNDGSEQRLKLRNAPRQEFDFDIAIPNGQVAELDSLLYGWRGNFFGLPISSECRLSIGPTSGSSPNIDVNTEFGDFRIGGLAIIYNSPTDFELVNILSFTTNQIIATADLTKVFPAGSLVMPVQVARLLSNPTRRTNGHRQRLSARFQVTENIVLPTSAAPDQYKGFDVYLDEPLTIGPFINDTYNTRVDLVDFETGSFDTFSPWLKTKTQRTFGVQFDNLEDVWNFRLWTHRREGKLRPFWMPTFEANFTLITTGSLDVELLVTDEGQKGLSAGRNDLAVRTDTGWAFREIISIVQSGNDLLVTLDTTLGFDASTVEYISFMGRKRLSSDRIEINWQGNNTGNASVPITEIND